MKPTYESFERFVMTQDASKPIDHGNWYSCAVGEYYREYNIKLTVQDCNSGIPALFGESKPTSNGRVYLEESQRAKVGHALNSIAYLSESLCTYGDLQEFIINID